MLELFRGWIRLNLANSPVDLQVSAQMQMLFVFAQVFNIAQNRLEPCTNTRHKNFRDKERESKS